MSDTFIKGANGKEVDLTPLLNSIKKNETSFNTEAEKQGLNYSLGVAQGILSGSPDVNAAVKSVIDSAIKTGQKTQDSHSPAKVPNKKLGKPFSQGVAKGILAEKKTVDKASRNIITTAVDAARDEAGIHLSSRRTYNKVGVPLVDGIAVAISDNDYKVSDAVEAMFDDLDLKKEVGAYTEEQYYADMEKLRDKYIKKGTKQWWDYTKKIISFEEKQAEEEQKKQAEQFKDNLSSEVDRSYSIREKLGIANADDEADIQKKKGQAYAKYCEDVKNATFFTEKEKLKLIKEYAEKSQDCFIDAYTVIADSAKDKFSELSDTLDSTLNDIESKEKAFSDRLKDHAPALTLATFSGGDEGDETFYTLTDWSKKTDEIMAYNNLLDTVLSRSNSKDFNSYILGLGIADAQKAAHLLNQLSDSDFADYVKKYEEYYKNSESLAFNRYAPEKEEAYNTYETGFEKITEETKDTLKDAFGDVPDDFFEIGLDSGEEFENGFLSVFETVADKVKSTFTKLVSEFKIKADGALGSIKNISYTSTYNLAPSSTDVTTQLRTIRDNEKLNEMRGGY